MRKQNTLPVFIFIACLLGSNAHGSQSASTPQVKQQIQSAGYYLPETLSLQKFDLLDHDGRAFTVANLRGRWTLLFFGYTHCPDVCPTTLAQLRATRKLLARESPAAQIAVVLVSVDPQRDSSEQLKQYVGQFGTDFIGVGGSPSNVDRFAQQFRVKYAISGRTSTTYLMDHTSSVALITPDAKLRALFSPPLRPEGLAQDLQRIVSDEHAAVAHPSVVASDHGAN